MKIQALQKLTLLDFPGKTACTVFTHGCNLRCPFCHNARLVTQKSEEGISEEEFFSFLKKRSGLLDGVCITGGEPLLQKDIGDFMKKIKAEGFLVKLDTNGFYPEKLQELLSAGLVDYVAMDIKSAPDTYAKAVGLEEPDIEAVKKSVTIIKNSGVAHEFRTTFVKGLHNASDLAKIGDWLRGEEHYYLQMFVDSGELVGASDVTGGFSAFSKEEMAEITKCLDDKVGYSVRGL